MDSHARLLRSSPRRPRSFLCSHSLSEALREAHDEMEAAAGGCDGRAAQAELAVFRCA